MKKILFFPLLMTMAVLFFSCTSETSGDLEMNLKFDFSKGYQGWSYGISDYSVGQEQAIGFECKYTRLPNPLNTTQPALLLSANNPDGNLFFFIKRQVSGLKPLTKYEVEYNLQLASNAPSEASAYGNMPQDVYIKTGATTFEPKSLLNGSYFEMNIDKGTKDTDGADAKMIGNIGNGTNQTTFALMERSSASKKIEVVTDAEGNMWLLVGFDAAYQCRTSLFVSNLDIYIHAI